MRIVFIGSKDRGVRCLQKLHRAGKTIVGVITAPGDDPDKFWTGSVSGTARELEIPVHTPTDINDPDFVDVLAEMEPDLLVLSGYNQILRSDILAIPTEGTINLHAGKLPEYRGGSPMNWAIINGETSATATIHYATERVDAGAILAEETFDIPIVDTIEDVREKTLEIFPDLLVNVVDQIEAGTADPRHQDVSEGTYWGSRGPQDGRIDFMTNTARKVYDFVRALTDPYPGAFTMYNGRKLYVWKASLMDETVKHQPGRICMARNGGRVVAARDRGLILDTVQMDGDTKQPAADLLDRGEYLR